ncbi:acetaldehyde dehydrogenase (acetylating) [Microbulbifer sp. 2304DJ12-6]|uniref:acetaldehyde dehydrogenase (acetylating) n=1 Tax=Microbulbifer sp. 2304DJ12-6 TaxID=3233340 RepID=UPI0039AF4612
MFLKTAILGSGNIGCDLLCKVEKSPILSCSMFVGRTEGSSGLQFAERRGTAVYDNGVEALFNNLDRFDLVFDATSAAAHLAHAPKLIAAGKTIVNLTPAPKGILCVPMLNGDQVLTESNVNMITCGGQASLPILAAIRRVHENIDYIEVVSSIAAKSAGAATRLNLDQYLNTTESAITKFTGCDSVKAVLNINPAKPSVDMQTAVSALITHPNIDGLITEINSAVKSVQKYVKGYKIIVEPYVDGTRLFTMIRVTGQGGYLASYAGNLDIITSSAVNIAERLSVGVSKGVVREIDTRDKFTNGFDSRELAEPLELG